MTLILDGKKVREGKTAILRKTIADLGGDLTLAILQVGHSEASDAYISQKKNFAEKVGVKVSHHVFPDNVEEREITDIVNDLNRRQEVHGIIVQLPIPERLDKEKILNTIDARKDIDGLGDINFKKLSLKDKSGHVPATARGILELLSFYGVGISGKKVAVLGRSKLVGAPVARLLENEGAIVSVCHSKTENVPEITKQSDIIVVAIGKPRFVGEGFFRNDKTQTVVDVGITAVTEEGAEKLEEEIPKRTLVGDVDFERVKDMVFAISPVPGGVGPMTVLCLFENLANAYGMK
ncbi:MAG: bifunctional 5,10-methylenetetrahydrofolate dehydrogenase/5,10-methenyltetrahydrofolate cyclohydrolase [bacterium]|nr:bifunctional 5,10-methylenetetrahydrofolate dehydrogenase/5,10-methenyltetrahydrofolate cyclohydrolase [bacterium]